MHRTRVSRTGGVLAAAAALAVLAGCSIAGAETGTAEPLRCEIRAASSGGMIALNAVLFSDRALSGTYQMAVNGRGPNGSSSVSQGSSFTAGAGETTLGNVHVSDNGATYTVEMAIEAGGARFTCSDTIGMRI